MTGAAEMVERILNMLSQYLISNQTLQLNNTFKLYLKILSIDSMKFKKEHLIFISIAEKLLAQELKLQKNSTTFGH